jgi:oligopeptidase B
MLWSDPSPYRDSELRRGAAMMKKAPSGYLAALGCFAILPIMSCSQSESPQPPVAKVEPHKTSIHGEELIDNYYWLRERSSSEVIDYLKAENAYTEAMTAHTKPLQEKLYEEMLGRIKQTDLEVPVRVDNYYYYSRTEEGKQYKIHCRKKGSLDADEEVLLDENQLAKGEEYFAVGVYEVSPDHRLLAYSTDTKGSEIYTLQVRDLATGKLLPDQIPNVYYSVEWANDNQTLLYNTLDEAKRPYKLFRHRLGADAREDAEVFHEPDDRFYLGLSKTRSRQYLLVTLRSKITSEVWYLDASRPADEFQVVHPRTQGLEYYLSHHGGRFFIHTNDQAKNFRVVTTPTAEPTRKNWQELIGHRLHVLIEGISLFRDYLVVYERDRGLEKIRISDVGGENEHYVEFDEPAYTFRPGWNPEFNSDELRFSYTTTT